jgi:hypothetical protein
MKIFGMISIKFQIKNSLSFMKNFPAIVRKQNINAKNSKNRIRMTNRCQRQVGKENQRHETGDACEQEVLVIKSPDATIEEVRMMITTNYAGFAHIAMKCPGRYKFSTRRATIPISILNIFLI